MIFVDDAAIKVGGVTLPGLLKSLEIKDDALIDEQEVQGNTKKAKQALGYEDAKITIELILEDGAKLTMRDKLVIIQNLFKKAGQDKPVVHDIINEHTAVRRITKVLFKSLSSKEDNKKTQITVSLEFWAYNTISITATKTKTAAKPKASSVPAPQSVALDASYQSYLNQSRGKSPAAHDDMSGAGGTVFAKRLKDMPF